MKEIQLHDNDENSQEKNWQKSISSKESVSNLSEGGLETAESNADYSQITTFAVLFAPFLCSIKRPLSSRSAPISLMQRARCLLPRKALAFGGVQLSRMVFFVSLSTSKLACFLRNRSALVCRPKRSSRRQSSASLILRPGHLENNSALIVHFYCNDFVCEAPFYHV